MINLPEMGMIGHGAMELSEEHDKEGRSQASEVLELVGFIGLAVSIVHAFQLVHGAAWRKGYRSARRTTERLNANLPTLDQAANRAYLGAWREAQQHYSHHFHASAPVPDHVEEAWTAQQLAEPVDLGAEPAAVDRLGPAEDA